MHGCHLGQPVLAFTAGAGCSPYMAACWQEARVADGPGRGDAFVTVLFGSGGGRPRPQRLHASLAWGLGTGGSCAPPYAVSGWTACLDGACSHYQDARLDDIGTVIATPKGAKYTCEQIAPPWCDDPSVRRKCPVTCRAERGGAGGCFAPRQALPLLQQYARWRWYSQAMQDSVLHMLLLAPGGVPLSPGARPFYVEFGYSFHPHSNSEYLRHIGWRGIRFDSENSQQLAGVFKEEITAHNVIDVFRRHNVPPEPDLVSIDIDSCDVWVFLALTGRSSPYRPRVVQIEYNRHFGFDEDVSLDCRGGGPPWGNSTSWPVRGFHPVNSNVYGASLRTVARAGALRGYQVVWVERCYDVFLVRDDLICDGDGLQHGLEHFWNSTASPGELRCGDGIEWFAHDVGQALRHRWLVIEPHFV